MFTLPDEPQPFNVIIANAFRLYRKTFSHLILVTIIAVVIGTLPHFFLPELNTKNYMAIYHYLAKNWHFFTIYLLISLYFGIVLIYRIQMYVVGLPGHMPQALWVALKRLPYCFIAAIITAIVALLAGTVFFIPGIVVSIYLAMYQPLVIIDGLRPWRAFKRSFKMVGYNWWRTFIVIAISTIFFFAVVYCIDLIALDLWQLDHPRGKIWASYNLFRMFFNSLYYPLFCCMIVVLFHDLQLRYGIRSWEEQ